MVYARTVVLRERFAEAGGLAGTDDERALLELLLEHSPYLMELVIRDPARLSHAAADAHLRREKPLDVMRAELAAAAPPAESLGAALRDFRHGEYVRLGARELGGFGTFEEVGRELAHLADTCFGAALAATQPPTPFCVLAMGKHGGRDLNFSSDVDVLYVYAGDADVHEACAKAADRVTRLVAEPTDRGACFRVDLRLRPEGTRGPLVNSLTMLERYYETWGRPWERQAWIKARGAAGDDTLADETLVMLAPFVYPRAVGPAILDDVRAMLARAQKERGAAGARDVKLGRGGIREVEFFTQALQLLHGGKNPSLRERGTLRALDKLLFAGLIGAREHQTLAEGYVFLRRVENRLQLEHGAQTHELPVEPERVAALARRMGLPGAPAFEAALAAHRDAVHAVWTTLGVEESPSAVVDFGTVPFRDGEAARDEIDRLTSRPGSPFASDAAPELVHTAQTLIAELAESPDPDQAIRHLCDFTARRGAWSGVWRMLGEHRPLGKLVISLFGTSEFLARRFVEWPELIDQLLGAGRASPRRSQAELGAQLGERLAGCDYEAALGVLRRFKQEEELRIGLHELMGELAQGEVFEQLSALAETLLGAALDLTAPTIAVGGAPHAPLSVVALGKLGAREIDFGSDLDLLFVHGGHDVEDHERTARRAQRLIRALTLHLENGRLYEIDTRLRPSGRDGLLVTTLPALTGYHEGAAQLWERQALIKARAIAGDPALGDAIDRALQAIVYDAPLPGDAAAQIDHLRDRMERELSGEHTAGHYNLKLGRGGLVDIEFVVQLHQLMHGGRHLDARNRKTLGALDALAAAGLVSAGDAAALGDGYRFLRRLENRLRIVHDRSGSELYADPPSELHKLARRMGYHAHDGPPGERLLADYLAITGRVRAIYERVFARPCAPS
jgi:glutamate-ammonia-ligase adenylyltransferase